MEFSIQIDLTLPIHAYFYEIHCYILILSFTMDQNSQSPYNPHNKRDPFKGLPFDVYVDVLSKLTPKEIIRCERVSPWWRECIEEWTSTTGYLHMLGPVGYKELMDDPKEKRMSHTQLKEYCKLYYSLHVGQS